MLPAIQRIDAYHALQTSCRLKSHQSTAELAECQVLSVAMVCMRQAAGVSTWLHSSSPACLFAQKCDSSHHVDALRHASVASVMSFGYAIMAPVTVSGAKPIDLRLL